MEGVVTYNASNSKYNLLYLLAVVGGYLRKQVQAFSVVQYSTKFSGY
jgi:hypothetical protein